MCRSALFGATSKERTGSMRLQLTRRADYAVRAMTVLAARPTETVNSSRIQELTGIPTRFVVPVMSDLARAALVVPVRGRSGGPALGASTRDVTVLAVVDAVE